MKLTPHNVMMKITNVFAKFVSQIVLLEKASRQILLLVAVEKVEHAAQELDLFAPH